MDGGGDVGDFGEVREGLLRSGQGQLEERQRTHVPESFVAASHRPGDCQSLGGVGARLLDAPEVGLHERQRGEGVGEVPLPFRQRLDFHAVLGICQRLLPVSCPAFEFAELVQQLAGGRVVAELAGAAQQRLQPSPRPVEVIHVTQQGADPPAGQRGDASLIDHRLHRFGPLHHLDAERPTLEHLQSADRDERTAQRGDVVCLLGGGEGDPSVRRGGGDGPPTELDCDELDEDSSLECGSPSGLGQGLFEHVDGFGGEVAELTAAQKQQRLRPPWAGQGRRQHLFDQFPGPRSASRLGVASGCLE